MTDHKCGDTFGSYKCTLRKGHDGSHAGKAQDGNWAGWSSPGYIGSWQERESIDEAIRLDKENSMHTDEVMEKIGEVVAFFEAKNATSDEEGSRLNREKFLDALGVTGVIRTRIRSELQQAYKFGNLSVKELLDDKAILAAYLENDLREVHELREMERKRLEIAEKQLQLVDSQHRMNERTCVALERIATVLEQHCKF